MSWESKGSTWTTTVESPNQVDKLSKVDLILTQLDNERKSHIEQINSLTRRNKALEEDRGRQARQAASLEEASKQKDLRIHGLNEQIESFLRLEQVGREQQEQREQAREQEQSGKESEEVARLQEELVESGRAGREKVAVLEEMLAKMRQGEDRLREEACGKDRRVEEMQEAVELLRAQVAELEGKNLALELEKENVGETAESKLSVSVMKEEGEHPYEADRRDQEVFDSMLQENEEGKRKHLDSLKIDESAKEMDEIFKFRESIRATIRTSRLGPANPFQSNAGHRQSVVRNLCLTECETASSRTS